MAEAARRRGYAYQVLTDHSMSLAIARGLAPDRVEQQRSIIAELNKRFEQEEREGTAPAGDAARRLPPPPRLRAGDPRRRAPRLPRQAARAVRPRRRVAPRQSPPAARRVDAAHAQRDPQPARRRDRPPVGPHDPDPRRSRPRLGHGLRGGRPDRHGARDERLATPARSVGGARPPGARRRLRADHRLGRAQDRRAGLRPLGHQPGTPCMGRTRGRPQHAQPRELLAWVAGKPARVAA